MPSPALPEPPGHLSHPEAFMGHCCLLPGHPRGLMCLARLPSSDSPWRLLGLSFFMLQGPGARVHLQPWSVAGGTGEGFGGLGRLMVTTVDVQYCLHGLSWGRTQRTGALRLGLLLCVLARWEQRQGRGPQETGQNQEGDSQESSSCPGVPHPSLG